MTARTPDIWHTKLHAWLHDPPEKPLVLMRDPGVSHEDGTAAQLRKAVFGTSAKADGAAREFVRRADWWSSSADRAAFPKGTDDGRFPAWQKVQFTKEPVLVHPLSGQQFKLHEAAGTLESIAVDEIKAVSLEHFTGLIHRDAEGAVDLKKTLLAFWRFGPELDNDALRALWSLLPADTRTPDHTIWQHLDLTSAFAGAFNADVGGEAALLGVTFGPIQPFIAVGRSTSDLWAGSHFLSRLAWEGLKVIADELGPDAVLFPQLRGVPLVDAWLASEIGLDESFPADAEWKTRRTDANPLFVAALPNKFVAVVPSGRAAELAGKVTAAMREFVLETGQAALRRVLQEAVKADAHTPFDPDDESLPAFAQLREQLTDFPDVHWVAVPFFLAASSADSDRGDPEKVRALLSQFHADGGEPGFLGSAAWRAFEALKRNMPGTDAWFWEPRPGTLYPALYDLLERNLAANKSVRPFGQWQQEGYRCSLSAEVEWLTTDREQLGWSPGQRKTNGTLWTRLAEVRPSWVKAGEHLGALAIIKRLWPTLFVEWMKELTGLHVQRYVVSSHTLALSTSLGHWLAKPTGLAGEAALRIRNSGAERSALPGSLVAANFGEEALDIAARIPAYLDGGDDAGSARRPGARANGGERNRQQREEDVRALLGRQPETYYGLVLMDGDQMGRWLSGELAPRYDSLFHPRIREHIRVQFGDNRELSAYRDAVRAPSPAFHAAISAALNGFSVDLVQRVVERLCKGKLLYAGGDDVMALSAVDDLPAMLRGLRVSYAGHAADDEYAGRQDLGKAGIERLGNGHALVKGRLVRLLGESATASAGAVIAHQMAPLAAVLRELRAAEARAKNEGDRDAFSLSLVKRSGGTQHLTAKWRYEDCGFDTLGLLDELKRFLASDDVSRRAVYHSLDWIKDLPEPDGDGDMLRGLLAYQFERQAGTTSSKSASRLAERIVQLVLAEAKRQKERRHVTAGKSWSGLGFLKTFLSTAEFLAREKRTQEKEA